MFYWTAAPKPKNSDVGNSDLPKRNHRALPSRARVNLYLIKKKKKNLVLRLLRFMVRTNILWNYDEEKWNFAGFALHTANVKAIVHNECLVKMEKALNIYNKILRVRDCVYINLITVYCYNCSILLLIIVHLLWYLICKLDSIIGIYI